MERPFRANLLDIRHLGRCPTAIKLRNSRSRSQAPAWERPCFGGSSLPFLTGALCFWRPGRRLEPPGILHSQAGAWERARVTRSSKLNLMAVGRCPRLVWGRAVGADVAAFKPECFLLPRFGSPWKSLSKSTDLASPPGRWSDWFCIGICVSTLATSRFVLDSAF